MEDNADRDELGAALRLAREFRKAFELADKKSKGAAAERLFYAAANVLQELVGSEALEAVYGKPSGPLDQASGLKVLAQRVWFASQVFPADVRSDNYSLSSASEDLRAMSHGDAPQILRKLPGGVKGEPINAFHLAKHQLAALCWEKYLRGCGDKPAVSQNAVASAYGATWTTIARWTGPIERALGKDYMEKELELASSGRSACIGCIGYFAKNASQAEERLKSAGQEYQKEMRRRVDLVD